ncbi:MAG: heavy metal translocating P-type ATPase [Clostridia bacterium]|nr:heavy metal translocating P-type ATPase [Clostridia bacterium]
MKKKHKKLLIRIIIAAVLTAALIPLKLLSLPKYVTLALAIVPYLIIGYDVLRKAAKGIIRGQVLDECFLMSIATIGAFVLGYISDGDFFEAPAVMLFYQIGELFQGLAVDKSRKNIAALMDIRPDHANLIVDAENFEGAPEVSVVSPEEVAPGSLILIKPGEKVPIDGTVEKGESALDTAALTGESVPRTVRAGDEVLSGTVNLSAELVLRTTKEFGESTVSRIMELVENASDRKSKSENFISSFARIYTPAVCIAAVLLAVLPPLISRFILNSSPAWTTWLYRALAFLVASCPCALVVSIPLGFFASLGGAGREGILIKGASFIEALSRTQTVVFDKTGTLTEGSFEVVSVEPVSISSSALLELAALAETDSPHPIALSLIRAYGKTPDRSRVGNIRSISGKGVIADVDGRTVAVGNAALLDLLGVALPSAPSAASGQYSAVAVSAASATCSYVCVDNIYAGRILISDRIKTGSKGAIEALHSCGITRTVMLTGDRKEVAEDVASALGIDKVYSELLPGDKVDKLEALLPEGKLAFVGDGINDAPVLVRADIGVAMGGIGSDAAIEAADVVLMDDDPMKIATAIRISKKCMRIIYENICFSIGVKLLSLVLVALGVGGMWLAIFADVGVMVLAVLNAVRALVNKGLSS